MIKNFGIKDVEKACEVEPRNRTHGRAHHSYASQARRDFEMYAGKTGKPTKGNKYEN